MGELIDEIKTIKRVHNNNFSTHAFETEVVKLAVGESFDPQKARDILSKSENEEDIRFIAFFCLHVYYRRFQKKEEVEALYEKYSQDFAQQTYIEHIKLERYTLPGAVIKENTLKKAKKDADQDKSNDGKGHLYCLLVAMYYESDPDRKTDGKKREKVLREALERYDSFQEQGNMSARFCDTKGRMEALLGQYDDAVDSISLAIQKEHIESKDYYLRIAEFQNHLHRIELMREKDKLNREIVALKASRIKMIEVMGLMVAVMTFLAGSLQITSKYSALEAAGLILVLMGALGVVFCGVNSLIHSGIEKGSRKNCILLFVFSILLILCGLVLCGDNPNNIGPVKSWILSQKNWIISRIP